MEPKSEAKKHLQDYEHYKKMKRLADIGSASMLGLAAYGGSKKSVPALAVAFPGIAALSYASGKASRKSQQALNKLKSYYDLRDKEKMQKTAVVGGIVELLSAIGASASDFFGHPLPYHSASDIASHAGMYLSTFLPEKAQTVAPYVAPLMAAGTPTAIDLATLPTVGHMVAESARRHAYLGAKQTMGLPLTPAEELLRAKSLAAVAKIKTHKEMEPGVKKFIGTFVDRYRGPRATGGQLGETAGTVLKEISKSSPTLAREALEAIKSDAGLEKFKKSLTARKEMYSQAAKVLDSTVDEVPGLRKILLATGKSGKSYVHEFLEQPKTTIELAERLKSIVQNGVRSAKMVGAGTALGIGAYYLGKKKKLHPLSQNEVPMQLAQMLKKEDDNLSSSQNISQLPSKAGKR